jgi:4-amino-4-deoxy-L-arabinose transferase-like glycosyltransferase
VKLKYKVSDRLLTVAFWFSGVGASMAFVHAGRAYHNTPWYFILGLLGTVLIGTFMYISDVRAERRIEARFGEWVDEAEKTVVEEE